MQTLKEKTKNAYQFKVTHRLANGTEVTKEQLIKIVKKLPPLEIYREVDKCYAKTANTWKRKKLEW